MCSSGVPVAELPGTEERRMAARHSEDGEQEEKATVHDSNTVTLRAPRDAKSAPQWVLVASELETQKTSAFVSRGFAPQSCV
jgi:hypothetical protein